MTAPVPSVYRTDGTGYGHWTPLCAFASQGDAREFAELDSIGVGYREFMIKNTNYGNKTD